jgi:hypothetical protein
MADVGTAYEACGTASRGWIRHFGGLGSAQNLLGLCLVRVSVDDKEKFIRLQGGFIFHDTVLGYARAVERGAEGTQPSQDHGSFQSGDDPGGHGSRDQQRADGGHPE